MKRPRSRRGRRSRPSSERKRARELLRRRTRAAAPKGRRRIGASRRDEPTLSGTVRKIRDKAMGIMLERGSRG